MSASLAEVIWYNEDSASPLTVTKPAAFASGQVLVAIMVQHGPNGSETAMTAPTGWIQQGADLAGTSSQGRVFSHVFNGGDPSTWDFPYSPSADVCLMLCRITGADTAALTIVVANTNTTNLTSSYDSPSITPTGTDDLLVCTISDISNGNTFSVTAPSGMTSQGTTQVAGGFMAEGGASLQLSSGSATGVKTWTSVSPTGADGGSFSVAIKSTSTTAPALPLGLIRRVLLKPPFPVRRAKITTPVRAQVNPPVPLVRVTQPLRIRSLLLRRPHLVTPVRVQVNPPIPLRTVVGPRLLRGLPMWRALLASPPWPQQAPATPPALPPQTSRHPVRLLPPTRLRTRTVPTSPAWVTSSPRPRPRLRPPTRLRRVHPAAPDQQTPPAPPSYPPQTLARHRLMVWPRSRGRVPSVAALEHSCVVVRPVTGAVARPGPATIVRPDTGDIERPC